MASGSTSFASAFTRMHTCLMQNPLRSYNFVFMNDGEDTENNEKKLKVPVMTITLPQSTGSNHQSCRSLGRHDQVQAGC